MGTILFLLLTDEFPCTPEPLSQLFLDLIKAFNQIVISSKAKIPSAKGIIITLSL